MTKLGKPATAIGKAGEAVRIQGRQAQARGGQGKRQADARRGGKAGVRHHRKIGGKDGAKRQAQGRGGHNQSGKGRFQVRQATGGAKSRSGTANKRGKKR